jgi:hypothetical protein
MADWIATTIKVIGTTEQVQQIKELMDLHTSEQNGQLVTQFPDVADNGTLDEAWGFRWGCPDDEEHRSVVWMGECQWNPPGTFVNALSRRYSDCEFEMTFSRAESWYVETYLFQNGDSRLTYKQSAYFEFYGQDTTPVHHWISSLSFDSDEIRQSVLAALREHGLLVD